MQRRLSVVLVLSLLLLAGSSQGEPGGVGNDNRDMQCGGACHGDSDMNETSSVQMALSTSSTFYIGIPGIIDLTATNLPEGEILGFFLLMDTTRINDTPGDHDWSVTSYETYTETNYIEVKEYGDEVQLSWMASGMEFGTYTFTPAVQHGGEGTPYFALGTPLTVEVVAIPEEFPHLTEEFASPASVILGENTRIDLPSEDVTKITAKYKINDINQGDLEVKGDATTGFYLELPTLLEPGVISYQLTLTSQFAGEETPWYNVVVEQEQWQADSSQVWLQSIGILFTLAGLVILLQSRNSSPQEDKQWDQTQQVLAQEALNPNFPPAPQAIPQAPQLATLPGLSPDAAPIPASGLPAGWTVEQWNWYGHDYLSGKMGGGL